MRIVIEIPDDDANFLMNSSFIPVGYFETVHKALYNGTPLPKGHGDLIDRDYALNVLRGLGDRDYRRSKGTICDASKMISYSEYVPTVIPADKEGEG